MKEDAQLARNADIRLRRSSVSGNVPTIEQLNLGELAVNTADGKLFLKRIYDGIEQVIEVGADARTGLVSTFNTYTYTSDGTLQNISGVDDYGNHLSYDLASPRRLQVYLNGILLIQTVDYTAPDGNSILLSTPVDAGQTIQVAAYNSDGASIDADFILDDGFSFTVGTDEETKFYHNGTNTILKHLGYNNSTFNMMWQDSDRLVMSEDGIAVTGSLTLNGNNVLLDSDALVLINNTVTTQFVEDLNLSAGAISYTPDSAGTGLHTLDATNVQAAIDQLHQEKLDIDALASSIVFYPTSTASPDVSGYNHLVTTQSDSDYDAVAVEIPTGTIHGDDNLLGQLVSDQGVIVGNTGVITIHTIGNIRRVSGNSQAKFYFTISKMDENDVETLLARSSDTRPTKNSEFEEFYADALLQNVNFLATDRVVLKFYGTDVNGGSDAGFVFQFGGDNPVRSQFPVPVSAIPSETKFASQIITTTSSFDGILSGNEDDIQKALDVLDDITTTVVPEGTNQYFTTTRARASILGGGGITYNSTTGIIEVDSTIATKIYAEAYTQVYADSHDAITLTAAASYADGGDSDTLVLANEYTDNSVEAALIEAELSADSNDAITLSLANQYADTQDVINLSLSNAYTDSAITIAITNLVDGAPAVLDTMNEIAAALGDDSDFFGTVQNWVNQKLDATATTDAITEGTTNLYFTQERARQSVSAGNGLLYNIATGEFELDSTYDASFNTVTATTFTGDLIGNADTATNADNLDGQNGAYYRINVYDVNNNLLN